MPCVHRPLILAFAFLATAILAHGQSRFLSTYSPVGGTGTISPAPPSNSVSHIHVTESGIWIGTSKGLARTVNGGRSWENFGGVPEFAAKGIFSLTGNDTLLWTSTGYTKDVDGTRVQTGSGYTYTVNGGLSWTGVPQTLDAPGDSLVLYGSNTVKFLPIVVPEQNVTFDAAVTRNAVWIASWSSGLRRSTDRGQTWLRTVLPSRTMNSIAPEDTLTGYKIDPRLDNNYLAFSVYAETEDIIWAGTAGGINKSTDGGISWIKFRQDSQVEPILSDWVIAIEGQEMGGRTRVWSTNWPAEGSSQQYGVSFTDDGGRTWTNHLRGVKAYDFAFRDSTAYVATDEGIFRTTDGGQTWDQSGTIIDESRRERLTSTRCFAVGVQADTLYCGTEEGTARTVDTPGAPFGQVWEILRAYVPVGNRTTSYAYPNPFTPRFETVRFHYATGGQTSAVTIEVFDFGMNRVRTVVRDAVRSGEREHDEIWDGTDEGGKSLPNGVYFYRITMDGSEASWGKVMVLQ
jgi:photosystem II stability/assembly factor-like uncharacterized protein